MKTSLKIFAVITIGLLSACAPRGENKSVQEVYDLQKDKFNSAVNSAELKAPVAASLKEVSSKLDSLTADANTTSASAEAISENLANLITNAGYTSRPAMTELMTQYRELAKAKADPAAVKLLAARTYSALAAELETTKFAL